MAHVIYRMLNTVNQKCYIGQTNDFRKRMNGHRSDANNPNSHSYKTPLSFAIRKYGWEAFENYVIEYLNTDDYELVDKREQYWIEYYQSLSSLNGYNITIGGQGCPRPSKTYEERVALSKIFSPQEIYDIQMMLINGEQTVTIREKYYPRLSNSFLDNINSGLNFKNNDFTYPLSKREIRSLNYTTQEILEIKNDIRSGMKYSDIQTKWRMSAGMVSNVNNGKVWHDKNEIYPLSIRSHSKLQNANTWVKEVQEDLMNSSLLMTEIADKYDKAYSTIKKINSGASHKNLNYKYPLTSNRNKK